VGAKLKKYTLYLCAVLLCAHPALAETWQGTCVSILDGDSLLVMHAGGKKEVRLYGIDAPEFDQPFGTQARACTQEHALYKKVSVEPIAVDAYGRTVAKVGVPGGGCLNEQLLAQGCAWVYKRYCKAGDQKAWSALEQSARLQGLGLWAQPDPVPPWVYRNTKRAPARRQVAASDATPVPATGLYHGNTKSRVFHAPGCPAYSCKNCTAVFNSPGEALRAGYRPCKKCCDN